MGRDEKIHAKQGKWKVVPKDDIIIGYTGTFHKDDESSGLGTAKFLRKSGIVDENFKPEIYKKSAHERVVIELRAEKGHNLETFQEFALKHDLIKNLQAKIEASGLATMQKEFLDKPKPKPDKIAYKPLENKDAKALINQLLWESIETNEHSLEDKKKGKSETVMVTSLTDPEIAFQVAYYLHKKDYISKKTYDAIHEDIKLHQTNDQPIPEIRISISEKNFAKLSEKIPTIRSRKKSSDAPLLEWAEAIIKEKNTPKDRDPPA